jgi:2',3'-cyclic-nucleotide 2'-phosphodiesterase (5'-nucleotidase family)
MVLGGLARRVSAIKKLRAEGQPVLVVDSGDLFFDATGTPVDLTKARAKAKVIARAYKGMGVVAINVGDGDLLAGLEFLRQGTGQRLPLISANLVDPARKKPILPPFVIQEVSGIRIAFFGLLDPPVPPAAKQGGREVIAEDPLETARKVVKELTGKADLIILLSDLGVDQDTRIAKACPGIHFILGGHEGRYVKSPYREGETFIVQSYQKGMYSGRLTLTLEKPGAPFQDEGKADRIQEELNDLDRRISSFQRAQANKPSHEIADTIERLKQERKRLQTEMEQARKTSLIGNHFSWSLEPISSSLPEDKEVVQWIKATGITKD